MTPSPPWYADAEWFRLLAQEGWPAGVPQRLSAAHPEAPVLPLVTAGRGRFEALSNYYSPLLEPEGGQGLRDAAGLVRAWKVAGVAVLNLQPVDGDAAWLVALCAALRQQGYWVFTEVAFGNWTMPLGGYDAAAYLAGRPGPLRTSLQRGRARLQRAGAWNVAVLSSPGDALEAGLQAYEQVYARSWKPQEACPGFIRSLARWMAGQGRLRLGVLRLNGEPIAAQMWFVQGETAYIYKLAYDGAHTAMSPGTVLTAHLMQHVIDTDRVSMVDFLSGDDAYKRDWMSQRRERVAVLACRKASWRGLAVGARRVLAGWRAALLALLARRGPA